MNVVLPGVSVGPAVATPLAIDGVGNVWTEGADSSGLLAMEQFDKSGNLNITNNGSSNPINPIAEYGLIQSLIFDSNASSLWGSDAYDLTTYQISPLDGSNPVDYFPNFDGNVYTPFVAASANPDRSAGNVYGCAETGGQTLDAFNVSSTSILTSYPIPTGRGCGNQMVMDGAGRIFTVTGGSAPGIIDQFSVSSSGLTLISPQSTGYTGTSSGESPTINPDPSVPTNPDPNQTGAVSNQGVAGAAIDSSGNLWVLNANTGTTTSPGNALVEFIGVAAPIVTPTSRAISFGEVGVRPQ